MQAAFTADGRPRPHPLADLLAGEVELPAQRVDGAIDTGVLDDLLALEVLQRTRAGYAPMARVDRVGSLLVASDLRRHRRSADFVVGPGPASFLLARHVRPHPGGPLLDLGCGSGIQGLLLADERADVVALDINPRAVAYAAFNAAFNRRDRCLAGIGDFLGVEPDRGLDGRFQTVVANPPFVLAPRAEVVYRDRPLEGDEVGGRTVERAARALARDGRGYVLCNWIDRDDGDWFRRPRTWTAEIGVDAAAVRVASHSPAEYARIWTRDLPPSARAAAIEAWTAALIAEGARVIHTGVVALARRRMSGRPPRFTAIDRAGAPTTSWRELEAPFQQA
jgi:SAM-dependent methyltransferase